MRGQPAHHTLQVSALVNEAYLRLVDVQEMNWQNRAHFLAMAARLMRRVLVDSARAKGYQKRGANAVKVTLTSGIASSDKPHDLVRLDEALQALAEIDERKNRVVELRYFGGLSVAETAEVLGVSEETVTRDWRMARSWLLREMTK